MNIGNKIHELRERRGITQEQLSAALDAKMNEMSDDELAGYYDEVLSAARIYPYCR